MGMQMRKRAAGGGNDGGSICGDDNDLLRVRRRDDGANQSGHLFDLTPSATAGRRRGRLDWRRVGGQQVGLAEGSPATTRRRSDRWLPPRR